MKGPGKSTEVAVGTAGAQEDLTMTGASKPSVTDYEEKVVCLFTNAADIYYRNDGGVAVGAAPSKSLKAGERFFDYVPAGGGLTFIGGASGVVEIIPFS